MHSLLTEFLQEVLLQIFKHLDSDLAGKRWLNSASTALLHELSDYILPPCQLNSLTRGQRTSPDWQLAQLSVLHQLICQLSRWLNDQLNDCPASSTALYFTKTLKLLALWVLFSMQRLKMCSLKKRKKLYLRIVPLKTKKEFCNACNPKIFE